MHKYIHTLFGIFTFSLILASCQPSANENPSVPPAVVKPEPTSPEATRLLLNQAIEESTVRPFNGVVLLHKGNKKVYELAHGFVNAQEGAPIEMDHQFVIGSISKQIAAVLLLRQFDQGRIDLNAPVSQYLPAHQQAWLDSISAHQLLNHSSGVVGLQEPLAFLPGEGFHYSGDGYQLIADLTAAVSGVSFDENALVLFQELGMYQTKLPFADVPAKLLRGYACGENGEVQEEENTFYSNNIAAGLVISSAPDLLIWNKALHGGKLLEPSTYAMMTQASSQRLHPIYGEVGYGYGIQVEGQSVPQLGHSGYAPGFVSTNYHFPKADLDLIVLENLDFEDESFQKTFHCEQEIRRIVELSSWAQ